MSQPDCALICWKQETIELELETLIKLFLRNSTGNHHRPANWTKEGKNHHLLLDAAEDCEKIKEPLIFINILQYLVSSTYILLETISILQNLIFLWVELVKVQRRTLKFKPFIVQWVLQRFFSYFFFIEKNFFSCESWIVNVEVWIKSWLKVWAAGSCCLKENFTDRTRAADYSAVAATPRF